MVVLAFATVYIVWGSTYYFIQRAVQGFPPFLLGAIRFLIAGMLMLGWSLLRGEKIFVWRECETCCGRRYPDAFHWKRGRDMG